MDIIIWCRQERCKSRAGGLDGSPKTKEATRTVTAVVTGRLERREIGRDVLISLAKFQTLIWTLDWPQHSCRLIYTQAPRLVLNITFMLMFLFQPVRDLTVSDNLELAIFEQLRGICSSDVKKVQMMVRLFIQIRNGPFLVRWNKKGQ